MSDPLILDPMYVQQAMSQAALQKLIDNPATNPDTTPPVAPEGVRAQSMTFIPTGIPKGPGDALATQPTQQPVLGFQEVQQPKELSALNAADKDALEVLKRDGIIEQVGENSWRFTS